MSIDYAPVQLPGDHRRLVEFLCTDEWPFHGRSHPTEDDVDSMGFTGPDVASFWMIEDGYTVGLIRLLDLGDIGEGAPLFDVRIARRHRGRGLGRRATDWLVDHLFSTYPTLHRIEANTRADNVAMRRVLSAVGFTHEGTLRQAWHRTDGLWSDAMVYGILRSERT